MNDSTPQEEQYGNEISDDRLTSVLGRYATDFSEASESADSQEVADAYAVLSALARGRSPPEGAARRVVDRAQNSEK